MPVLDIELSDSQFIRNCNTVSFELSEKSIREKDVRGKNEWSQFFCCFTQQFHEEQSTEAYSLWRRNNKAREGYVPLRINERVT